MKHNVLQDIRKPKGRRSGLFCSLKYIECLCVGVLGCGSADVEKVEINKGHNILLDLILAYCSNRFVLCL